jgi:hypothetical protein
VITQHDTLTIPTGIELFQQQSDTGQTDFEDKDNDKNDMELTDRQKYEKSMSDKEVDEKLQWDKQDLYEDLNELAQDNELENEQKVVKQDSDSDNDNDDDQDDDEIKGQTSGNHPMVLRDRTKSVRFDKD